MSSSTLSCNKTEVLVRNVPEEMSEENLFDLFSTVGRVLNIRSVLRKANASSGEGGGPIKTSFAFVEFGDSATALSAVRNLNQYECHGTKLKLSLASSAAQFSENNSVKSLVAEMSIHKAYEITSKARHV
mmetsp:Transcript_14519/g.20619  ORF Transcript_14519/g.20619 Transcript_14519/m.20619 type:complete len:130 (-) Transcript_14519:389-778(-)